MIDLYTIATPNGRRVSIMLEECCFPYRAWKLDPGKGETRHPEFLKLNPLGMLPVIVDLDGPGGEPLTLTQSGAIALYLAEKAGRFIPTDARRRVTAMRWFMAAMTDAAAASGAWVMLNTRVAEKAPAAIAWFENRLLTFLAEFDRRLGEADYLADELSVADLALYPIVAARRPLIEKAGGFANLDRWAGLVGSRPGVIRGMGPA
jgi:GST-like protein